MNLQNQRSNSEYGTGQDRSREPTGPGGGFHRGNDSSIDIGGNHRYKAGSALESEDEINSRVGETTRRRAPSRMLTGGTGGFSNLLK